jgi:hypothetical protein
MNSPPRALTPNIAETNSIVTFTCACAESLVDPGPEHDEPVNVAVSALVGRRARIR